MAKKKSKHKSRSARRQAPAVSAASEAQASVQGAPVGRPQPLSSTAPAATVAPVPQSAGLASSTSADGRWAYVGRDLRRIGILAALCILLELVLWYTLSYTSFGASVYSLVHVG